MRPRRKHRMAKRTFPDYGKTAAVVVEAADEVVEQERPLRLLEHRLPERPLPEPPLLEPPLLERREPEHQLREDVARAGNVVEDR